MAVATLYVQVCTTNLTVICCIHRHIHHMSRIAFPILNFVDLDVYVAMTLIFPVNQMKCASSSNNVAIHPLAGGVHRRAQQIDRQSAPQASQKDKNHPSSLFILIITKSKPSFLIFSNYSEMIPGLVEYFRYHQ